MYHYCVLGGDFCRFDLQTVDKGVANMEEYSVRPLEEKDLRLVLDWRNSERVHSKMLTDHKITWEEHFAWFQRSKDNPVKRNLVFCYQGRPIGYIGYTEYDDVNMICSPGAYLGETDVPIDAGITLFYIAVEYAFAELHMKSLETSVFKSNKQAMRIDKFLGYKEVPGKEEVYIKNGKEEIALRMSMSKADWDKHKQAIIL